MLEEIKGELDFHAPSPSERGRRASEDFERYMQLQLEHSQKTIPIAVLFLDNEGSNNYAQARASEINFRKFLNP